MFVHIRRFIMVDREMLTGDTTDVGTGHFRFCTEPFNDFSAYPLGCHVCLAFEGAHGHTGGNDAGMKLYRVELLAIMRSSFDDIPTVDRRCIDLHNSSVRASLVKLTPERVASIEKLVTGCFQVRLKVLF